MFTKETYINRRKRLKSKLDKGIALIMGNVDASMNYPQNTYHFRQDSTFLYFFGLDHAGLAGLIDFESGEEMLFGDDFTMDDIIWMGPQPKLKENAEKVGINQSYPLSNLNKVIQKALSQGRTIHFTPPYRGKNMIAMGALLNLHPAKVKDQASTELIKACVALRSVKEPCEIEEMERHMATAYAMHTTAMKMAHPGKTEQEITGALEGISMSGGGIVSFPIICSIHGETLHNHYHGNTLQQGDLLLVDAGSESPLHYATDNTRTSPVGGQFTQKQKEIYQIVVNTNNKALAATKPGITYKEVHLLACKTMAAGLKDLGLMKGDMDEAVAQGAHALFMPHGLGHMIGLDVHDMEDYDQQLVGYDDEVRPSSQFGLSALRMGRKLETHFVVTNEPGIYFIPALIDQWKKTGKFADFINYPQVESYKNFGGIRLEDDILVTETGSRILGKRIPINPEDVEQMVKSGC
ncbi:aminopeptidase P family protein [Saccharicrinis fermentans]|uniref:Xaa-Pro aminopeptidase n=1 Tax=Saccharicrinis fermentans DSM 9555 = JCM 21142 TaxID=869213 RepID=W7YDE5_9BACT|nr:aminopeptidase P family protein [Saccharicrinis fermentans]GAF05513.1 Xaa-Pro aminopeptidase [Saccharicrinis fermentans DSM 9555 = JCM 21142]